MKGILFNIVEDVVTDHLGDAVWDQLLDAAGITHGHTALATYPDTEMEALIAAATGVLDQRPRQLTVWLGERAVPYFHARYPHYFDHYDSARTFLPGLDTVIHPEVRKLDSAARPPVFKCSLIDDCHMRVDYISHRPLCGLAEGMMRSLGVYYRERISVAHPECVAKSGGRCRFELTFG